MEYELREILNDIIPYKKFLRQSGSGVKNFFPPLDINCYVEDRIEMVRNEEGEEVLSKTRLYMAADHVTEKIEAKDCFVLNGKDIPVINRSRYKDEKGNPYVVVVYL